MKQELRAMIKEKGITLKQLAEDTGLTRQHLYKVMDGETPLTAHVAGTLDNYFGSWCFSEMYLEQVRKKVYEIRVGDVY